MSHANRGRMVVELGDGWRTYSRPLANAEMLGTVTLNGETGALIRRHVDGVYCLCIRGRMVTLHERKVEAALLAAKRKEGSR